MPAYYCLPGTIVDTINDAEGRGEQVVEVKHLGGVSWLVLTKPGRVGAVER